MERRDFLRDATVAVSVPMTAAGIPGPLNTAVAAAEPTTISQASGNGPGEMPTRQLGRTGQRVSAIGLGGFHIGAQTNPQDSVRIIRSAIDVGITFLDNSWDSNGEESEKRMGHALRDGYREKVFLMTKFDGRTKVGAAGSIRAIQDQRRLRQLSTGC